LHFHPFGVNVYETTKVIAFSSIGVNVYGTTKVITFSSIWVFMKVGQLRWMGNKLSTHPCWVLRVLNKTLKFQVLW
jgi:hypothetical protein